jgi:hypothetical protein
MPPGLRDDARLIETIQRRASNSVHPGVAEALAERPSTMARISRAILPCSTR